MTTISELIKQLDFTTDLAPQLEGWDERNRSNQLIAIDSSDILAVLGAGTEHVKISFDSLESLQEQKGQLAGVKAVLVMLCGGPETSHLQVEQLHRAINDAVGVDSDANLILGAEIDPESQGTISGVIIGAR